MNEEVIDPLFDRCCANCACKLVRENQLNKMEKQLFCRRDTPQAAQVRVEKPRMRDGKVVTDRHDKPIMEAVVEMAYLYKPTMPELVCFDGWRPEGTLPGERHELKAMIDPMMQNLTTAMAHLVSDTKEAQSLEAALSELDNAGKKN